MRSRSKIILYSLPLFYTYLTRLRTVLKLIQFFGGEFVSLTILVYFIQVWSGNATLDLLSYLHNSFNYSLIFVTFFTFYEIGYIVNDCIAIKKETFPTIRFVYCNYLKLLSFIKFITFLALSFLLLASNRINLTKYITYFGAMTLLIFLHNKFSCKDRWITYFWLSFLRISVIPIMVSSGKPLILTFLLVTPEVIRRVLRYIKIRYVMLSQDRRFSEFDFKILSLSVIVTLLILLIIFFDEFTYYLFIGALIYYSILLLGIFASIYVERK